MSTVAATPAIAPQNVSVDDDTARVDGVAQLIDITSTAAEPQVGYPGGVEVSLTGKPRLVDRAEWDEAHPGVEPTHDAMVALIAAAIDEIQECAEDARARREPDFDDGGSDWGDY